MQKKSESLTSRVNEAVYNAVLYNRSLKKAVVFLLKQKILLRNPLYQKLYQRTIKKKINASRLKPFRVMIENTNLCKAGCVFCPHDKMKRKVGMMSMPLFKKIIDECAEEKIDYVTIYGFGEPFLDKDFLERIKYAKSKGLKRVTTNTNAAFMTQKKAKELIKAGLDEIYISFDAATKETYEKIRKNLKFGEVEKNIIFLIKEKRRQKSLFPKIYLSFVENEINQKETKTYIKKWKDKVDGISFSEIHNWTGEVELNEKKDYHKDPCRLLWQEMVISIDGRVPLCCNDYENQIILGDLSKNSIKEIWQDKKIEEIRKMHLRKEFSKVPLCRNCYYNFHHKSPWWVGK